MKYIDEFRRKDLSIKLIDKICDISRGLEDLRFMEVCGTHTMAIARYGLDSLLPKNISLLSGPGCPVCVTPNHLIDKAIAYSKMKNIILVTFGDMLKVPGSYSSLGEARSEGADVRVVYSILDSLEIAKGHPSKKIIFFAVGFETTAPTTAAAVIEAERAGLKNFFVLCAHKVIPAAIKRLLENKDIRLSGLILPGHVSAIIGCRPYNFLASRFKVASCITGFEPLDILQSIFMLVMQTKEKAYKVEIQYSRVVKKEGNPKARALMARVFKITDSYWRGLGEIQDSGLKIRPDFKMFNIEETVDVKTKRPRENPGCICDGVLIGLKNPSQCRLFGSSCRPDSPKGACMVSSEGTCAAWYKYRVRH